MSQAPMSDVTSDDKLWAALGYPIGLIAIIVLLMEDKKSRPYIKYHAVQALAVNIVFWVIATILSFTLVGLVCVPLIWIVFLYWAYQAYQGQMFEVPVVTSFIRGQGWV
ncbi:MAG: DUF4870 domain-containing protein [Chloroflexota bacterium]